MKLIYLWIESYQFIKKQGYLLNSGYQVRYDRKREQLKIVQNDNIDSLIYGDKITITAIVGDNGTGKSTLLDAIRIILFDDRKRNKEIRGFLLLEDEGNIDIFPFMEKIPKLEYDGKYEVNALLPKYFNLIYYSDFLEIKYYLETFDDGEGEYTYIEDEGHSFRNRESIQLNISTSYLLREKNGAVLEHLHSDIKRQINFYDNLKDGALPFPVPTSLSVKLEFLSIDIFDRVLDASLQAYEYMGTGHHGEINTKAFVIGLLKEMEHVYQGKTIPNLEPLGEVQILQWNILVIYIYNLLEERIHDHENHSDYTRVDEKIQKTIHFDVDADNFWDELEDVFSGVYITDENFEIYLDFYKTAMDNLRRPKTGNFNVKFSIPDDMAEIIFNELIEYNWDNNAGWNGGWDIEDFNELFECYTKISYNIDFLNFSWGMSSGESSMFNLFARLYAAMVREEKEKVILLFDELDSMFHPKWQQEIIASLTKFLRNMYPQKQFQIIMTTHSPVLLSDIPKDNVIFLGKHGMETEHKQTYAANIASLYYDSFFMEKGSIGDVARGSIANLLEAISELEHEEWERAGQSANRDKRLLQCFLRKQFPAEKGDESIEKYGVESISLLQKLIDSIGEDIWRYKVNERFHYYLQDDVEGRKKEIWDRLTELAQIEGRKSVDQLFEQWRKEKGNDSD